MCHVTAPAASTLRTPPQGNAMYEKQQFAAAEASYSQAIAALESLPPVLAAGQAQLQHLFPTFHTEVAVLYSNRCVCARVRVVWYDAGACTPPVAPHAPLPHLARHRHPCVR